MVRLSELEEQRREQLRRHGAPEESPLLRRYTQYVREQRRQAGERLDQIDAGIAYERLCLQAERAAAAGTRRSDAASRRHAAGIQGLLRQRAALVALSPDAFMAFHEKEIVDDVGAAARGRLVDVPYLHRARKRISDSLDAGIPVYLVGHLGSGKTQLALESAQERMRDRLLREDLTAQLQAFRQAHPAAAREEELAFFSSVYGEAQRRASAAEVHPYFVAGSRHLTAEDLFLEKTLRLSHAGGKESYAAQLDALIGDFVAFMDKNRERMRSLDSSAQLEMMLAGWKTFSELYISENSGFGTTVETIEKEVLLALREGKPVIIDELNTIAMPNLIALNDILQHHAGQSAYITGVGTVRIAEGFCLIGTGNLSTATVFYEGTNTLNPAFQSRFTTLEYNYVPQSTEGTLADQKSPEKNELFRLVIEHLCDESGELQLPEPARSLDGLWRLCQMARLSQNIFEGRSSTVNEEGDAPVLAEAVLSIRNLIHLLDLWNLGEEMDLSTALWNGFLCSVTNGDDRNLLLALGVRYGFFSEREGWTVQARARGEGGQTWEDIRPQDPVHEILPLQTLSREDVVHLLWGPGPARTQLPEDLQGEVEIDRCSDAALEAFLAADEQLRALEHSAAVLTQVAESAEAEQEEMGSDENG